MEAYIARQPIFDRKMNVYGYELLYRKGLNNFYEGLDDGQSTSELIRNAFLVMQFNELTNGTKAFINFSRKLLENQTPLLLPKETIVVEILERVEANEVVIESCKELKRKGYILALDDFVFNEAFLPLIELADIIKIEFNAVPQKEQLRLIKKYKGIKFLAEKIETREDYEIASEMGYDFFQGYFFSKPVILASKKIEVLNSNLIKMIEELNQEEPNYQKVVEIIERDLGLTYKLLKLANSTFFASQNKIYSIKQALVRLGIGEMKKWAYLMTLREIRNNKNNELIINCLVRGKSMELLSIEMGMKNKHLEFFLTGMFSSMDTLLNRKMEDIIIDLPLTSDVEEALLKKDNQLRRVLDKVICYELGRWDQVGEVFSQGVTSERFTDLYFKALKW